MHCASKKLDCWSARASFETCKDDRLLYFEPYFNHSAREETQRGPWNAWRENRYLPAEQFIAEGKQQIESSYRPCHMLPSDVWILRQVLQLPCDEHLILWHACKNGAWSYWRTFEYQSLWKCGEDTVLMRSTIPWPLPGDAIPSNRARLYIFRTCTQVMADRQLPLS